MRSLPSPLPAKPLYEALGVSEKASADEIRAAFLRIARFYHPDVNREESTAEYFRRAEQAHAVLSDPAKRALYDQTGIDPRADSVERHALAMLSDLAFRLICEGKAEANLVQYMRGTLAQQRTQVNEEIGNADKVIAVLEKHAGDLEKRWKGAAQVRASILERLRAEIAKNRETRAPLEQKLKVLMFAAGLLESANYEFSAPPVSVVTYGNIGNTWVRFV